jgi:hypothetical protein
VQRELTSVAEMREVLSTSFGITPPPSDILDAKLAEILAAAGIVPEAPEPASEETEG